jgi:hypothetical protein
MSEYEYTNLNINEHNCSSQTNSKLTSSSSQLESITYSFRPSSPQPSFRLNEIELASSTSSSIFNILNLDNKCSTLKTGEYRSDTTDLQVLPSITESSWSNEDQTQKNSTSNQTNELYTQYDYDLLKTELNILRSDLSKFRADILLNELRLELSYLADKIRNELTNEFMSRFNKLAYEQSVLNARLAAIECKLNNPDEKKVFFLRLLTRGVAIRR